MTSPDIVTIQQLIRREREARDRGQWEEMRLAFSPSATVDVSWYQGNAKGFIERSTRAASQGISVKHRLGPVEVRIRGSRALATASASIESREMVNGIDADLTSHVNLQYRLTKTSEAEWRISFLTCIYDKDCLASVSPEATLVLDASELQKHRASYRFLSYILEQKGISISRRLPGQDMPSEVQRVFDESFRWLQNTEE